MEHSELIALEGLKVVSVFAVISFLGIAAGRFGWSGGYKVAAVFALLTIFSLWFFRNPERHAPVEPNLVVSPADGKVVFVGEVDEGRILHGRAVKVSIFMSVFNVHVNRAPETGRITEVHYNKGKFVSANLDKASLDNEQNALVMQTVSGKRVMFVQIAGLIARRIVCWVKPGDDIRRGERFGLIMFGSRLDIYLPVGSKIKVKLGDKPKAGETVIGELP
jgi:phosphatidylserine decarboxylase